ncbi:hypothetical protein EVAR_34798_1 [Eumeta japonica]|uniref:Uncharacterized protein n=1 Tax=Eumeta variegata TaxID=151549 RepID=A0A4C1WDV6_EUMVA|nr:hypothetical protein EVAR_34798_1 [Eumeta japonica]
MGILMKPSCVGAIKVPDIEESWQTSCRHALEVSEYIGHWMSAKSGKVISMWRLTVWRASPVVGAARGESLPSNGGRVNQDVAVEERRSFHNIEKLYNEYVTSEISTLRSMNFNTSNRTNTKPTATAVMISTMDRGAS